MVKKVHMITNYVNLKANVNLTALSSVCYPTFFLTLFYVNGFYYQSKPVSCFTCATLSPEA